MNATNGNDEVIAASARGSDPLPPMQLEIVVYTQGWEQDRPVRGDEPPTAQLHGRVFVDGQEITMASGITVKAHGADFMQADIHVFPSSVRFESLNEEEWKALGK